jgi:hypothetical protein
MPAPEGCQTPTLDALPVLPMPWRGGMEAFLRSGSEQDALAIDYDVSPPALVTQIRIDFMSDRLTPVDPVQLEGRCPDTLATSLLHPPSVTNDVVAVRVSALDEERSGRFAEVFFPVGDASLEVATDEVDPRTPEGAAWYLVYEPGWGEPRIALFEASITPEGLMVTGLPDGPATIALIQTDAVRRDDEFSILYGPPAFAADWIVWTQALYAAVVVRLPDAPLTLEPVVPHGRRATTFNLGDEVTLSSEEPYAALAAPPAGARGALSAPCGATVKLWVGGFAILTAFPTAPEPQTASFGEMLEVTAGCDAGGPPGTVSIDVRPQNGRTVSVVASLAGGAL